MTTSVYKQACLPNMILLLPVYAAKCLVLMNNHEEMWVMAEKLQTELGDPLSKDDLVVGATVIYQYRGKPYEGEILEVKCKSLLFKIYSYLACSCI